MHYDSSEAIPDADPRAFAASVEERAPGTETIVLDQGETVEL
jgi:L-ascorbate metabolism protein UlaG (beta-lactamase superfamily)